MIVARILPPLMRHTKQERSRVYGHNVQGLLAQEHSPELQRKYLDLIDSALSLTDNERQQYVLVAIVAHLSATDAMPPAWVIW